MTRFALLITAALLTAAPALAQDLVPQPGKTEPVQPGNGPTAKAAPSTPLSGVIVQAPKLKPCRPSDKACQATVIEELWKRYPAKVEEWCTGIQARRTRERFNMEDLLSGGSAFSQTAAANFDTQLPEPERTICMAHGKPPEGERPFVGKVTARTAPASAPGAK